MRRVANWELGGCWVWIIVILLHSAQPVMMAAKMRDDYWVELNILCYKTFVLMMTCHK